jgi:hypothetical protein
VTISNPSQLRELIDVVHDLWFNVESLVLCEADKSLTIELEPRKSDLSWPSKKRVRMIIRQVKDMVIKDTEKVRDYDIDEINFDPSRGKLAITCGIPLVVELTVDRLEIEARFSEYL